MKLEKYFRAFSYVTVCVASLTLVLAGGLQIGLAALFFVAVAVAWNLEDTKWQLSERVGLILVLLSVPLFFLDWKFQSVAQAAGTFGVTALAHLIVFLAGVKLLQHKRDRDWVFLYLISFFEILLAAGLSFSPVFLFSLSIYMLCGLTTIVAFEITKAKRRMPKAETRLLVAPDSGIFKHASRTGKRTTEARRLPVVALVLFILIFVLALPLFLLAPRSGAAMLGRSGHSLTNFIGFSENVTLGAIGELKRDDSVVMHVRLEDGASRGDLRWRGVALDEFTGRGWRKSEAARRPRDLNNERGFYQLGTTESLHRLTTQTIFLEPIESPALFAAPRPVAIQGDFSLVRVDPEGSIQARRREFDRIVYKALSDTTTPDAALLRRDNTPYSIEFQRYLQYPADLDPRIEALANAMVVNVHAGNRYDEALAIESQLQSDYGYSLDMKASGPDPLSDFLFNKRVGHCEYFSTAMAVMLRTRGIASRVVNGFLPGQYNDAAGAYTVRESDAHSWVEVYFPDTHAWVTFDATPPAGRTEPVRAGVTGQFEKYAEALELMWFQYVVGYDKQEQRTLATAVRSRLVDYQRVLVNIVANTREVIIRNHVALFVIGGVVLALLILLQVARRVKGIGPLRGWNFLLRRHESAASRVEFYERFIKLLEAQGVRREPNQTPLEFAAAIGMNEAQAITKAYNRVRYGEEELSFAERREIEEILGGLLHS